MICPFCAVGCGLVDGLRGDPAHPVNEGALCARGAAALFDADSRERLLEPMRRVPGGAWERISWDDAIRRAAGALLESRARTWDPERAAAPRLAFLGGATAMNEEAYLFARLARHLGVLFLDHQARLCHSATTAALGGMFGLPAATHSWEDLVDAKWILVLGSNPADAHPIAARWLARARRRGAAVMVADPRRSPTVRPGDLHLALRPGSDVALLNGLCHAVLERGAVDQEWMGRRSDAGDLGPLRRHLSRYGPARVASLCGLRNFEACAALVTERRRGAILFSMGVTQHTSGVATVRAAAILQALLGNLEGPGGGLYPMKGHANIQGATDLGGLYHALPGYLPAPTTDEPTRDAWATRHGPRAAERLDGLLRAWYDRDGYERLPRRRPGETHSMLDALAADLDVLVLLGQNPLRGTANPRQVARGLGRCGLVVSIDPFLTETARACEVEVIALPAAAFSEKPGTRTNACRLVQWQRAERAPRGEARPDARILDSLWREVARPGVRWPRGDSDEDFYRATGREIAGGGCWLYAGYDGGRWHWPGGRARLFDDPGMRVRLGDSLPEHLEPPEVILQGSADFPLSLTTAIAGRPTERCGPRRGRTDPPEVTVSPTLARGLALVDGDHVWLETPRARAAARLRVREATADGVVWAPADWAAGAEAPDLVLADPADPTSPVLAVRAIPCRLGRL